MPYSACQIGPIVSYWFQLPAGARPSAAEAAAFPAARALLIRELAARMLKVSC
jgi:hypothetical protein